MRALVCVVHGIGNCIRTLPLINALNLLGYKVDVRLNRKRGAEPIFKAHAGVAKVFDTAVKLSGYDVACCTQICGHFHKGCAIGRKTLMIEPGRVRPSGPPSLGGYKKHEIDYNMDLARELGYTGELPSFDLTTADSPANFKGANVVALGIGYLKMDDYSYRKHWGNEHFARFAELLAKAGFLPVLLGGASDRSNAEDITKLANTELVSYWDQLSLAQTFDVLSQCRAVVCNETMMVPAASALSVPCLSLVFQEAKHSNLVKNRPYRNGAAIHDKRAVVTPTRVLQRLTSLLDSGK